MRMEARQWRLLVSLFDGSQLFECSWKGQLNLSVFLEFAILVGGFVPYDVILTAVYYLLHFIEISRGQERRVSESSFCAVVYI